MWYLRYTYVSPGIAVSFKDEIPLSFEGLGNEAEATEEAQRLLKERKMDECKISDPFLVWKKRLE